MNPEMIAQHIVYLVFFAMLGACVGSFLNVVVWRLPRGESLVTPPSRCPKCGTKLAWYDNVPVFGWLMLRGKCRYCSQPISPRYPIIEAVTGLIFALYYYLFFVRQIGPCASVHPVVPRRLIIQQDWPIFGLYLFTLASLLAASLIDGELFIIPPEIPWLMAAVAVVVRNCRRLGEEGEVMGGDAGTACLSHCEQRSIHLYANPSPHSRRFEGEQNRARLRDVWARDR